MNPPSEYVVQISPHAERDLDSPTRRDLSRIDSRIRALATRPRPHGVTKIKDKIHRIRVGAWRIIYLIDDENRRIVIERVLRREKDTYRSI